MTSSEAVRVCRLLEEPTVTSLLRCAIRVTISRLPLSIFLLDVTSSTLMLCDYTFVALLIDVGEL